MPNTAKQDWRKRTLWLTGLGVLRTWLPSILLHVGILLALTFVTVGVGMLNQDGDDEHGVSIVLREDSENEAPEYLDQKEFEQQELLSQENAPTTSLNEALDLSELQQTESIAQTDAIIGLSGKEAGGGQVGGGSGGGGGSVSFFGIQTKGNRFVYVVDRSGSMSGKYLQTAKAELKRSINSLPRGSRYTVYFFSSGYGGMSYIGKEEMKRSSRKYNKEVFQWIDTITAEGGTEPIHALRSALALKPDVIYFLTDGEFDQSTVDEITKANRAQKTQIHSVAFSYSGKSLLQDIARRNFGVCKSISVKNYKP